MGPEPMAYTQRSGGEDQQGCGPHGIWANEWLRWSPARRDSPV